MKRVSLALLAASLTGCLPGDARPVPSSVLVTAEPSAATAQGFMTADGWDVRIDRFLTALGTVYLASDYGAACDDYSDTSYARLFDFAHASREKVGLVFGLGTCDVGLSVSFPYSETLLGAGASQQDVATMQALGSDLVSTELRQGYDAPTTFLMQGEGQRNGVVKRFEWAFRAVYAVAFCFDVSGDGYASTVELHEGGAVTHRMIAAAEELFRDNLSADGLLKFQPVADADGDGDGHVTFEELSETDAVTDEGIGGLNRSLLDLLYGERFPQVVHPVGGRGCQATPY